MCGLVFEGYFVHHVLVGDRGEGGGFSIGFFFSLPDLFYQMSMLIFTCFQVAFMDLIYINSSPQDDSY